MNRSKRLRVTPLPLSLALVAALPAATHSADSPSLTLSVSERVSANTNASRSDASDGVSYASTTNLALSLRNQTRSQSLAFTISGNVNYARSASGTDDFEGFDPRFSLSYTRNAALWSLSTSLRYTDTDVQFLRLVEGLPEDTTDEDGEETQQEDGETNLGDVSDDDDVFTLVSDTGTRRNYGGSATLRYTASRLDTFTLSAGFSRVDYTVSSSSLAPRTSKNIGLTWSRPLSSITRASLRGSLSWFDAENATNTSSLSSSLNATLRHSLSSYATFSTGVGVARTETERDTTTGRTTTENTNYTANAAFRLQGRDSTLSLGLNQSLNPTTDGDIVTRTNLTLGFSQSVSRDTRIGLNAAAYRQTDLEGSSGSEETRFTAGASLSQTLTPRARMSLRANASRRTDLAGTDDEETRFSAGANFSYQLPEEAAFSLGYAYTTSDTTDSEASHRVFATIRKSFDLGL
jgi:hypothetical protein